MQQEPGGHWGGGWRWGDVEIRRWKGIIQRVLLGSNDSLPSEVIRRGWAGGCGVEGG